MISLEQSFTPALDLNALNLRAEIRRLISDLSQAHHAHPGTVLACVATSLLALASRKVRFHQLRSLRRSHSTDTIPALRFLIIPNEDGLSNTLLLDLASSLANVLLDRSPPHSELREFHLRRLAACALLSPDDPLEDTVWTKTMEDNDDFLAPRLIDRPIRNLKSYAAYQFTPLIIQPVASNNMNADFPADYEIIGAMAKPMNTILGEAASFAHLWCVLPSFLKSTKQEIGARFCDHFPAILPHNASRNTKSILDANHSDWAQLLEDVLYSNEDWEFYPSPLATRLWRKIGGLLSISSSRRIERPVRLYLYEVFYGFAAWHYLMHRNDDGEIHDESWWASFQFVQWILASRLR